MITLYVIRHGQTDWNIQNRLQGSTDIPLNSTGILQAQESAFKLKNIYFDFVISSPLKRAFETAKEVNKYHDVEILLNDQLKERFFGDLEGKTTEDLNAMGFSIHPLLDYYKNCNSYNVETIQDLFFRIENFVNDLKKQYDNKTILISTHNGIAQVLDVILNKLPKTTNLLDVGFKNCEYRRYIINE